MEEKNLNKSVKSQQTWEGGKRGVEEGDRRREERGERGFLSGFERKGFLLVYLWWKYNHSTKLNIFNLKNDSILYYRRVTSFTPDISKA